MVMICELCGHDHRGRMRCPVCTRRSRDGQRLVGCVGDRVVREEDGPQRALDGWDPVDSGLERYEMWLDEIGGSR